MIYKSSKSDRWSRMAELDPWQRAVYMLKLAALFPTRLPKTEDDRMANWQKMDQALDETIEATGGSKNEKPLKETLETGPFGRDTEVDLS